MKTKHTIITTALLALSSGLTLAAPLGPAFTYQGRLEVAGQPANGYYDVRFALYAGSVGGSPLNSSSAGSAVRTNLATPVSNGLFTVPLGFGPDLFNGDARWLQLSVRTNNGGAFSDLLPRQELTAAPYALYAPSAGVALSAAAGAIGNLNLAPGAVTSDKIAAGTITPAALSPALASNTFWRLAGNSGTTSNNFLGTLDAQALELRANNARALRIEPQILSPNLIGGDANNAVTGGAMGAVIAGGGNRFVPQLVTANYGTIGGGVGNSAAAMAATIGGGSNNSIQTNAENGWVGGGTLNSLDRGATNSAIGGGHNNRISSGTVNSLIAGGGLNLITSNSANATIGGGYANQLDWSAYLPASSNSVIAGGLSNRLFEAGSAIGGGVQNTIGAASSRFGNSGHIISGGVGNRINYENVYSAIGGGRSNFVDASRSTIAGGEKNRIDWTGGAVGNSIGGGQYNNIGDFFGRMGGPVGYSTIGGGCSNRVAWDYATIGGGSSNLIAIGSDCATIAGGHLNFVTTNADYATIPGGRLNTATNYAFAAGHRAKANHQGAFVWADSYNGDITSTNANSFTIRAAGGYRLFSNSGATAGVYLAPGSGSWSSMSDRNAKEELQPVNCQEVLRKVAALPLSTWNYKSQDARVRHIGPMAQDFMAAFNVGESDIGITTIDADGVALAAIQGLNQKLEAQRAENAELKQEVAELKRFVQQLSLKFTRGAK